METLNARIRAAFDDATPSGEIAKLIDEVAVAARQAADEAERCRQRAVDPISSESEVRAARQAMQDAEFSRDRMAEAERRLCEQLEVAQRRESNAKRMAVYRDAEAQQTAAAAELAERWPALEAEIIDLLTKVEAADAACQRANQALPDGKSSLGSTELRARGLPPVINNNEVPRLTKMRVPAWDYSPLRRNAWPAPKVSMPDFQPRVRELEAYVSRPFRYPGLASPIYQGTKRLPEPVVAAAEKAKLAQRLDDSLENQRTLARIRSGALHWLPESEQHRLIKLGELEVVELDFSFSEWAAADKAEQEAEWRHQHQHQQAAA